MQVPHTLPQTHWSVCTYRTRAYKQNIKSTWKHRSAPAQILLFSHGSASCRLHTALRSKFELSRRIRNETIKEADTDLGASVKAAAFKGSALKRGPHRAIRGGILPCETERGANCDVIMCVMTNISSRSQHCGDTIFGTMYPAEKRKR